MINKKTLIKTSNGQSLLEFIISFTMVFAVVYIFIRLAINMTNGYLVHYATFMASRTFLVWDNHADAQGNDSVAAQKARESFEKYRVNLFVESVSALGGLQFNFPNSGVKYPFVGTFVDFTQNLSFSNLLGGSEPLKFRSESFLGREPIRKDCLERICKTMEGAGLSKCSGNRIPNVTFFDDGC